MAVLLTIAVGLPIKVAGGSLTPRVHAMILVEPYDVERIARECSKHTCFLVINPEQGELEGGHGTSVMIGKAAGLSCLLPVDLMEVQDLSVGTHFGVGLLTDLTQSTESLPYLLSRPAG